jgi:hypothetical protein
LDHRRKLISDIRGASTDTAYMAGMLELAGGALLRGLGYEIAPHPPIEGVTTTPDFAFSSPGGRRVGLLEVTTVAPADDAVARGKVQTSIAAAIDQAIVPTGFALRLEEIVSASSNPSPIKLQRAIQRWIDETCSMASSRSTKGVVEVGGWRVSLELLTVEGFAPQRAIALQGPYTEWLATAADVRKRLEVKAKRYGRNLRLPFVIIIGDTRGRSWGEAQVAGDLAQCLFGDEVIAVTAGEEPESKRRRNGFWLGANGPRNTQVSAVLFFPDLGFWGLRNRLHMPLLALNPWAVHSLPEDFSQLRRMEVENGRPIIRNGCEVADVLGLPDHWPGARVTPIGLGPDS